MLVHKYTKYFDEAINYGLRHSCVSYHCYRIIQQIFETLDNVEPYEDEVTFYRGVRHTSSFPIKNLKVGDIIRDFGFTSKSASREAALKFTRDSCCLLIIQYPKQSVHLNLEDISYFPDEMEFLTYPGEIFEITKIEGSEITVVQKGYMEYNIDDMLDHDIDILHREFIRVLEKHLNNGVFITDVKLLIANTDLKHPEIQIMSPTDPFLYDRLYTLFVTGRTKHLSCLPDLSEVDDGDELLKYLYGHNKYLIKYTIF